MPEDLLPDFDLKIMPGRGVKFSPPYLVLHIHTNPISHTNAVFRATNRLLTQTVTIKANRKRDVSHSHRIMTEQLPQRYVAMENSYYAD